MVAGFTDDDVTSLGHGPCTLGDITGGTSLNLSLTCAAPWEEEEEDSGNISNMSPHEHIIRSVAVAVHWEINQRIYNENVMHSCPKKKTILSIRTTFAIDSSKYIPRCKQQRLSFELRSWFFSATLCFFLIACLWKIIY